MQDLSYNYSARLTRRRHHQSMGVLMHHGDILIHIDRTLSDDEINDLLRETSHDHGVVDACIGEKTRHLMVVDYNALETKPSIILHAIRQRGHSAEMIGL